MSNLIWFLICIAVGIICNKYGRWSKDLEMFQLNLDNTRLTGELFRMRKRMIKTEAMFFGPPPGPPIENIKDLEEIKRWD